VPNCNEDARIEVIFALVAGSARENQIVPASAAAGRTWKEMIARGSNVLLLQLRFKLCLYAAVCAFFLPFLMQDFEFHIFPRLRETHAPELLLFRAQAFNAAEEKWRRFGGRPQLFRGMALFG
jgi:hypothetical protein